MALVLSVGGSSDVLVQTMDQVCSGPAAGGCARRDSAQLSASRLHLAALVFFMPVRFCGCRAGVWTAWAAQASGLRPSGRSCRWGPQWTSQSPVSFLLSAQHPHPRHSCSGAGYTPATRLGLKVVRAGEPSSSSPLRRTHRPAACAHAAVAPVGLRIVGVAARDHPALWLPHTPLHVACGVGPCQPPARAASPGRRLRPWGVLLGHHHIPADGQAAGRRDAGVAGRARAVGACRCFPRRG